MAGKILGFRPDDYELVRKAVRHVMAEMARDMKPRKGSRQPVRTANIPLRLAKLQSGQTLDGSNTADSALADIYSGAAGSETVVVEGITVYQAHQLDSSETVDDTDYIIIALIDKKWQLVSPRTTGGSAPTAGMITVELPSDLALTDATKASCTVKATFSGGPSVASTVTITNPPAKGGNYQWQAESTTQYVNAIFQGGSTYLICSVQPVSIALVDAVSWSTPTLSQEKTTISVQYIGGTATTTVFTGESC